MKEAGMEACLKLERIDNFVYPQIYHKFIAKRSEREEIDEYCVQDLTKNNSNEAVEFMIKFHVRDEIFHKALRVSDNEIALNASRNFYREVFDENISLVCYKIGSDEIVGVNALTVYEKNKNSEKVRKVKISNSIEK
jgi:hypothetical protein